MSKQEKRMNRREFIRTSIRGAGLVGLGSAVGLAANRYLIDPSDERSGGTENVSSIDLSDYASVDPALVQYEEVGRMKARFQSLRGVAVGPDDRIYIAGDRGIQVFAKNADPLSEIKLNSAPRCLTITEENVVYVGMKDRVEVYDSKGRHEEAWHDLGQRAVLTSIAASKEDLFVADAGNREILRYSTKGKLVRRIGKKDKDRNIPGFVVPSPYFDLAVAPDGLLRVANPGRHRVEAYTFDGDFELSWGEASMAIEGFCGCCNPINFALLPNGKMVTSEKGLPRIKIYDIDGSFTGVVAGPEHFDKNKKACGSTGRVSSSPADISTCQSGGIDVAVDSQGRILALDPVESVVRIYKPIETT